MGLCGLTLTRMPLVMRVMCADEAAVQKTLSDLVGGDKTLLQGCFMVDQLVFTEMMYS